VPQITAVANVNEALAGTGVPLIADGGLRYSGDIAKVIAAGAHSVMIGGLFAGTDEAPGEVEIYQGRSYKSYRGMGSLGAMGGKEGSSDRYFQDARHGRKAGARGHRGPGALQGQRAQRHHPAHRRLASSMGYTGCRTIEEMRTKPQFRARQRRRHARVPRARRADHQGSAELPDRQLSREPSRVQRLRRCRP
jgi:IMP dehydrogenase